MTRREPRSPLGRLAFYASREHPCSYLPERRATTLFADPSARMSSRIYGLLSEHGFRRSGGYVYRPACRGCARCIPARIPVADFRPSRSQRRVLARNRDLTVRALPAGFREDHFSLYRRYVGTRHAGGGMDDPTPERYMDFLTSPWSDTLFVEMRLPDGRLAAVAVADRMPHGWSAVYTFFDPDLGRRSLGTYAVLWEIEAVRAAGLAWLYLGYWIPESRKMAYKARFLPLEIHRDGRWRRLADAAAVQAFLEGER